MAPPRRRRNGPRRPSEPPVQRRGTFPRAVPVGRNPRVLRAFEPSEHASRRRRGTHVRRTVRRAAGQGFVGLHGTERQPRGDRGDAQQRKVRRHHDRAGPFRTQPPHHGDPPHGQYRRRQRRVGGRPTTRCSSAKSRRRKPRSAARATTGTSISSWRCSTKPSRATTT